MIILVQYHVELATTPRLSDGYVEGIYFAHYRLHWNRLHLHNFQIDCTPSPLSLLFVLVLPESSICHSTNTFVISLS